MLEVKSATPEHLKRIHDVRVESTHGGSVDEVLKSMYDGSQRSWVCLLDGEPVILWGVAGASFFSEHVYLWTILSENIKKAPVGIARLSKKVIADLLEQFPLLELSVNPAHPLAGCWAEWLGFKEVPSEIPGLKQYRRTR